jgi:hypothetical protein
MEEPQAKEFAPRRECVEFQVLADGNELLKMVVIDIVTRIRHCV